MIKHKIHSQAYDIIQNQIRNQVWKGIRIPVRKQVKNQILDRDRYFIEENITNQIDCSLPIEAAIEETIKYE